MRLAKTNMGDLIPGNVALPDNPITKAVALATAKQTRGVGDLVSASFTIPSRPGITLTTGPQTNALRSSLLDTQMQKGAGMAGLDTSSATALMTSLQSGTSFGLPNYLLVGGGLLAAVLLLGGGRRGRR